MIQKEDKLVPSVTIAHANQYSHGGTRVRPKIMTPKKLASSANAVKLS